MSKWIGNPKFLVYTKRHWCTEVLNKLFLDIFLTIFLNSFIILKKKLKIIDLNKINLNEIYLAQLKLYI